MESVGDVLKRQPSRFHYQDLVLHDLLDQILIMKTARLTLEYVSDTFHLISSFF